MPSNTLIIRGERVPLPQAVLDAGGTAGNYRDDGEPHMAAGARIRPLTTFVIHETGGNTEVGAERSMQQNHLGVHLLLDVDGSISCYADLATEICWHASQCNPVSVGMEIVNEYRPEYLRDPHGPIIPAAWWTWVPMGQAKEYVCPTDAQMAVAKVFIPWICDRLGIPAIFPTRALSARKTRIAGWQKFPKGWSAKPGPGIVAHQDFSKHADGRYILEQLMEDHP